MFSYLPSGFQVFSSFSLCLAGLSVPELIVVCVVSKGLKGLNSRELVSRDGLHTNNIERVWGEKHLAQKLGSGR